MRERIFIKDNFEKWQNFEQNLKGFNQNPEKLRKQYIEVIDDLSYSKTFYKNRSVRVYLNNLAQSVQLSIFKNKKNSIQKFKQFFSEDIPKISFLGRQELLFAFVLLIISVGIGIVSSIYSPEFPVTILGEKYVNTTIENINQGNPFGIYKDKDQMGMFVSILTNNLRVSLLVFIFGIILGYGSVFIMISNGIMLGVFMYFFYSRNLSTEFNLTVWMHGSIEILTLVIETFAGILLGKGLITTGTQTRKESFVFWGKKGVQLFLATIPFIVFAAFIESFITRHTELPNVVRLLFIVLCVALMLFYFVVFPYIKYRKIEFNALNEIKSIPTKNIQFSTLDNQKSSEILYFSLILFQNNFKTRISKILVASLLLSVFIYLFYLKDFIDSSLNYKSTNYFFEIFKYSKFLFLPNNTWYLQISNALIMGSITFWALNVAFKKNIKTNFSQNKLLAFCILSAGMSSFTLYIKSEMNIFAYFFVFLTLITTYIFKLNDAKNQSFFEIITKNIKNNLGKILILIIQILMVVFLSQLIVVLPLKHIIFEFILSNFTLNDRDFTLITNFSGLILSFISFVLFFQLALYQIFYTCLNIFENETATDLKKSIDKLGSKKKLLGMEQE